MQSGKSLPYSLRCSLAVLTAVDAGGLAAAAALFSAGIHDAA